MMLLLVRDDLSDHLDRSWIIARKMAELMFEMFQNHAFHGFGRQGDGSLTEQGCDNSKSEPPKAA